MDYEKSLELNKDEMIFALRDVVCSNSEEGEKIMGKNGEVYPFGSGVQEAFEKVLALGESMGFIVKNVDNYGGNNEPTKSISINHIQAGKEMPVYVVE